MVYLIGVNHLRVQRRYLGHELSAFHERYKWVVESAIKLYGPELLAEEDNVEFLPTEADSILLEIADTYSIGHRFIDPDSAERRKIGYCSQREISEMCPNWPSGSGVARAHEIAHHFPKREQFWLRKLRDSLNSEVLFVCGWGHIESFRALLAREGVAYSIIENNIGATPSELENDKNLRQYIRANVNEFGGHNCICQRQLPRGIG